MATMRKASMPSRSVMISMSVMGSAYSRGSLTKPMRVRPDFAASAITSATLR